MAVYLPQASGLWSTTTWITAFSNLTAFAGNNTPPTFIDDVYADGKTITIDIDTRVRTLLTSTTPRTGGLAGGGFSINNAVFLSANILAGTTNCLTFSFAAPNTCTIIGNVSGSLTTFSTDAVINNSSGTINIFGNIKGGGITSARGVNNNSSGIVNIVGNVEAFSGVLSHGALNSSTGTINITGIVIGGPAGGGTQPDGARNNSTGTINISGTAVGGGNSTGRAVNNVSTGTVNVVGTVRGGLGSEAHGVLNNVTGTISVTGTVIGSSTNNVNGLRSLGTGNMFVVGDVIGGLGSGAHGIINNSSGFVRIDGNGTGGTGSGSFGAFNNATGYMEVNGIAIGNGWGLGSAGIGGASPGIFGSQTGTTIIRGLSCGPRGQWPTAGNVFIIPQSTSTATFETSAFQDVTLFTSLSDGIVPPVSSVRQGTIYNLGDYTGTCRIPSISSVLQGVAVDNSVGIVALQSQTIWNYSTLSATDVNSLGGRLKEVATVQSVGQQLTALN